MESECTLRERLNIVRALNWLTWKVCFECFYEKERKINAKIADADRKCIMDNGW